jgi:succinate dehydrogenase flavin-adding protein (antitoxin of CptAB toxin-antitoxin module)
MGTKIMDTSDQRRIIFDKWRGMKENVHQPKEIGF